VSLLSVVIPAHNEEAVIGDCLGALLGGAEPGELDVVVVCNGCSDGTEQRAAGFGPDVRVLATPVGSKPLALNLGDAAARTFPRLYVDADVVLPTAAVRAIDCSASSWAVRAYHRIWTRLPVVREGVLGRGVYALGERGRGRFEEFPDIVADDYFVHSLFAPGERVTVPGAVSRVRAPRTARDLVRRKTRVFAGNTELRSAPVGGVSGVAPSAASWLDVVRAEPRLLPDAPAYVAITLTAKARARLRLARGTQRWDRDDTSRVATD
jgi:glycosyltransferase involved in cell wall biosynthesis